MTVRIDVYVLVSGLPAGKLTDVKFWPWDADRKPPCRLIFVTTSPLHICNGCLQYAISALYSMPVCICIWHLKTTTWNPVVDNAAVTNAAFVTALSEVSKYHRSG